MTYQKPPEPGNMLELPPALDLSQPLLGPVTASVLATFQHEVYLSFKHQDKEETAIFCPGRMFINGSINLLTVLKSKEILRLMFKENMEFEVMVQPLTSSWELMFSSGQEVVVGPETKTEVEVRIPNKEDATVPRNIGWAVTLLVRGEQPSVQQLHNVDHVFSDQQEGWTRVIDRVHKELVGGEITEEEEKLEDNWFIVHVNGISPSNVPEKYPNSIREGVEGVIKEIHRPFGGIVDVGAKNGGLVKFHRNVLLKNGFRLGLTEVLEDSVILGTSVLVDISENSDNEGNKIFTEFKEKKIAKTVYLGDVPDTIKDHPELESHGLVGHMVRVVELYTDRRGMVTHGLGTIQVSQITRSGGAASSMVGARVTFKLEVLLFYGVRLVEGVDLKYLLSVGDEIHCQLKMLDTKDGGDQFVVRSGWLSKLTGSCSVRSHLLPESAGLHKWCEKKGVDWARLERRVLGKVDSKADSTSASETPTVGTVYVLEPDKDKDLIVGQSASHLNIDEENFVDSEYGSSDESCVFEDSEYESSDESEISFPNLEPEVENTNLACPSLFPPVLAKEKTLSEVIDLNVNQHGDITISSYQDGDINLCTNSQGDIVITSSSNIELDLFISDLGDLVISNSFTQDMTISTDTTSNEILHKWNYEFSHSMQIFMLKIIVPKLEHAFATFPIATHNLDLTLWRTVMMWSHLLPPSQLAISLDQFFFPRWHQVLVSWLDSYPNCDEVLSWYFEWKSSFPPSVLLFPAVVKHLNQTQQILTNLSSAWVPGAAEMTTDPEYNKGNDELFLGDM